MPVEQHRSSRAFIGAEMPPGFQGHRWRPGETGELQPHASGFLGAFQP
jgi:hypothetical protein